MTLKSIRDLSEILSRILKKFSKHPAKNFSDRNIKSAMADENSARKMGHRFACSLIFGGICVKILKKKNLKIDEFQNSRAEEK